MLDLSGPRLGLHIVLYTVHWKKRCYLIIFEGKSVRCGNGVQASFWVEQ